MGRHCKISKGVAVKKPQPESCPHCGGGVGADHEAYFCYNCGWRGHYVPLHQAQTMVFEDPD